VIEALRTNLRQFPSDALVFQNAHGEPLRRSNFWTEWRRATRNAGLPDIRFHELRHYYASLLIRHGESVKTVQARLGHASASETLDTYSHLWPDSDERTRDAVDPVLGPAADYLRPSPNRRGKAAGQRPKGG
jgi:integrase